MLPPNTEILGGDAGTADIAILIPPHFESTERCSGRRMLYITVVLVRYAADLNPE